MWRPFALSPFRLVISIRWKPNRERTGRDTVFSGSAKAAESNAGSMDPRVHSPRSPPFAAEALSADSRRATSAKGAPPTISCRAESARARASAVSEALVIRGRATKLRKAVAGRRKSSMCAR
jgi:hypothetical protein